MRQAKAEEERKPEVKTVIALTILFAIGFITLRIDGLQSGVRVIILGIDFLVISIIFAIKHNHMKRKDEEATFLFFNLNLAFYDYLSILFCIIGFLMLGGVVVYISVPRH